MQDFSPSSSKCGNTSPLKIICRPNYFAETILGNARSIGLQVMYDRVTPADGNCFYHAVIECLSYCGINFRGTNLSLRREVVNYVRQNENLPFVQTYILTLREGESFSQHLTAQENAGTHATELFTLATAMYLNIVILVTMEISNLENQYVIHYPNEELRYLHMVDYPGTFIIIGHSNTLRHFQSLKFIGNNLPWKNDDTVDFHVIPNDDYDYNVRRKGEFKEMVSNSKKRKVVRCEKTNIYKKRKRDALATINYNSVCDIVDGVSNSTKKSAVRNKITKVYRMKQREIKCGALDTINYLVNSVCEAFNVVDNVSDIVGGTPVKQVRKSKKKLLGAARKNDLPQKHHIGEMNILCEQCEAYKFPGESAFKCCHSGKVKLEPLDQYPEELKIFLLEQTPFAKKFRTNIRHYNSAVAFASFGANLTPPPGIGPPCFRICGQVCHRTGTLHPAQGIPPLYGQLYIYDSSTSLNMRMEHRANADVCDRSAMEIVQSVMLNLSPYAMAFKHMHEVEEEENRCAQIENRPSSEVVMRLLRGKDRRRYNLPHHSEVAAIFVGNNGAPPNSLQRDIVVYPRNRPLHNVSILSPNLDPMIYPLLFPRGEAGYSVNMPHEAAFATAARTTITMSQFYNYRLSVRHDFSSIFYGESLFQQYCVDAYTKVEGERIDFCRNNQNKLRVETYRGLIDNLTNAADANGRQLGTLVVLPSSFQGSPRAMQQHYQDAMAIVTKFGKPDLFLTFTCNPKWKEINDNLFDGQKAHMRPDLISRVFHMKLQELMDDINKNGILGKVVAFINVIEFQKRGLPHVHLLIHLAIEDKLTEPKEIDSLISAELPDPELETELCNIVTPCMLHAPAKDDNPDSPCMEDGKCSKNYPKEFCEFTNIDTDGYPKYRRRNDGRTYVTKCKGKFVLLDNRSIVPYCPWLTMKYNAHINLEACTSMKCVKYLYKYVYKGHDCANVQIDEILHHDEIQTFLDARYVSAPEAVWRIFEYKMHKESHVIYRLPVHLQHCQYVYFQNGRENEIFDSVENSQLLAWFQLNLHDKNANTYLYNEIPHHYVYNKKDKKWQPRKRRGETIITRLVSVKPNEGERYFLRTLLLHKPGAKSYNDLLTINGVVTGTFREACLALGLLRDDQEWHNTMCEAVVFQMPYQLRQLFGFILIYCEPSNPLNLWETFKGDMVEDFVHRGIENLQAEYAALSDIDRVISQAGKTLSSFNLPELLHVDENVEDLQSDDNVDITGNVDVQNQLNDAQRQLSDTIIAAVQNNDNVNNLFYLDAPAGTGKTFTFNYLVSELTRMGYKVKTGAWTGIAATLLKNGSTLHKLFRLPVPILDTSTCRVSPTSKFADELRAIHLFILDESSMIPVHAFNAIDRMLRDICNNNLPFGGKIILFGGDFRQVLPIIRNGRPAEILEICLKNANLWPTVRKFNFSQNMRALPDELDFCEWLLKIGNGLEATKQNEPFYGSIQIPQCCTINSSTSIVEEIYGDVNVNEFVSRVILTPTNEESLEINNLILPLLAGDQRIYYSADEIQTDDDNERAAFPVEFINKQTPSGMPPHCLKLKAGAIVMLLRNLDLNKGLCNGTRLTVTKLHDNIIQCRVITGIAVGNNVLIPRLQLAPSDTGLPFTLSRRQFPLRLAYSMTINKSQGQTFEKVGIYLKRPCFSHGQLYVAFSRARSFKNIVVKVCATNMQGEHKGKIYTTNVVYPQVLNNLCA